MESAIADWRSAALAPRVRAALGFLEKLTLAPETVTAGDARALRAAGLSDSAIEDAIHVCVLFNVYDRLADALEFDVPDRYAFAQSASMLLTRGYD